MAFDHSTNFFIYVLWGERFRQDLFEILPCCQKLFKEGKRGNDLRSFGSMKSFTQTHASDVFSTTEIEIKSNNRF